MRALRSSVQDWNRQRARLRETNPQAEGADLRGADFARVALVAADLRGAHLEGSILTNADLTGADLTGAHLQGADLSGAILTRAVLDQVSSDNSTIWPSDHASPSQWDQNGHVSDMVEVVRVERLSAESLGNLIASAEPIMTVAERMIESGRLPGENEAKLTHRLGQVRRELYENPSEPDPTLVEANMRNLLASVTQLLPVGELEDAAERAARESGPVLHLMSLVSSAPSLDSRHASTSAGEVANALEELIEPNGNGATRSETVLRILRWGGSGAIGGVSIQPMLTWMPYGWAAAVGAVVGILINCYETRRR